MVSERTGVVEIKYIDYTVARSLQITISDWFAVLPKSPANHCIKIIQKRSHWLPRAMRLITFIVGVFVIADILPHFIDRNTMDLCAFGKFFLYSALGLYVAYNIANWWAIFGENAIDRWSELSYIKLNKGDEKQITDSEHKNRNSLIKALVGMAASLSTSIFTKVAASVIVSYFVLGSR